MRLACLCLLTLAACASEADTPPAEPSAAPPDRTVAVTIDDLPTVGVQGLEGMQRVTTDLIGHLQAFDVPAIGFVNEGKLGRPDPQSERVALLRQWTEAGLELGNHTYGHPSFWETPLETFKEEVRKGEIVTTGLLAEHDREIRYFRHPYLNTGPDSTTKADFEAFLSDEGYEVAPVTIDNDEWIYAHAYRLALEAGDDSLAARIGADYVRYMESEFAFFEALSRDLLDREPAQTLLIHANALNADYLDELLAMIQARGYRFVSLEDALDDPAYDLPDHYTGRAGLSWLYRWQITRGLDPEPGPEPPDWLLEAADMD